MRNRTPPPRHSSQRISRSPFLVPSVILLISLVSCVTFVAGNLFPVQQITNIKALIVPSPSKSVVPTQVAKSPEAWNEAQTAGIATPGTHFKIGDSVSVPIVFKNNTKALVSVSLDSITPATPVQFTALEKSVPQLRGMAVYFLKYSITKQAGAPLEGFDIRPLLNAISEEEYVVPGLDISQWKDCEYEPFTANIDVAGTPYVFCLAAATPVQGLMPVGGQFSQVGSPYDVATHGQIIWKNQTQ